MLEDNIEIAQSGFVLALFGNLAQSEHTSKITRLGTTCPAVDLSSPDGIQKHHDQAGPGYCSILASPAKGPFPHVTSLVILHC